VSQAHSLRIEPACTDAENDAFLQRAGCPLVHYSSAYARFLARALPGAELHRLAAYDRERLVGVLPFATKEDPALGRVLNSLPFFGSHGGAFVDAAHPAAREIEAALHDSLGAKAALREFASVTVIENPLCPIDPRPLADCGIVVVDDRIGQISPLPHTGDIEAQLFAQFDGKTRNMVRKGQAQGQSVARCDDLESVAWLQGVHEKSIRALGGIPKPLAIFRHLLAEFPLGSAARLYVGLIGGRRVAGLLLLLYGQTVEYFTPVVNEEDRDKQVLSHVIFHAMAELAREGFVRWNWGGTWRSQEGVYRFKQRWGATDRVYRYFNRCDAGLRAVPRETLASAFPFFYLYNYQAPVRP